MNIYEWEIIDPYVQLPTANIAIEVKMLDVLTS